MRLHEWRANRNLLKAAAELHGKNEIFRRMLDVTECESPINNPLSPTGPSADDRSYRLGLIEGYALRGKIMEQLWTQPPPPLKTIKATFEAPE